MLNHRKNVHNQKVTTGYTQKHLYANIPYRLQPYHKHNKHLHVQLDTCADVNLMPESIYKLVFNDPHTSKLAKNDIDLKAYTRHSADPYWEMYLLHVKQRHKTTCKSRFLHC